MIAAWIAAACAAIPATAVADEDPVLLFREGMEAYRAGRCEEATTKLESALAVDPDLHSARLPLAECYYKIGIIPGAINHLKVYITELEPGPERERAQAQLQKYQTDMATMVGLIESVDVSEVDTDVPPDADDPDGYDYSRFEDHQDGGGRPDTGDRSARALDAAAGADAVRATDRPLLFVDVAFGASHFVTSYQPTLGELDVGVRLYPARFLGVGLSGRVGVGGSEGIEGALTLPQVHLMVGPVLQSGPALLLLGADAFLIGSKVGDQDVVDPGIAFTAELRGRVGDSPLYVGGGLSAGYAVAPYVAGRAVIGIALARVDAR